VPAVMPPLPTTMLLNVLERLQAVHVASAPEQALRAATEAACFATGSARGMSGLTDGQAAFASGWFDTRDGWTERHLRWEIGRGAPGHVARSGKPLLCNALPADADGLVEATDILHLDCFACVPLTAADGTVRGFLEVGNKPEPYSPADVRLLAAIAQHTSLRLAELAAPSATREAVGEREVTDTLRRALAPEDLPPVEGAEVAVLCRYRDELGGDFFDVMSFSPHSVALVIGDVTGHGIGAATLAVMAKYTVRAIAATRWPPRPGEVLAEANNALQLEVDGGSGASELARERFVTIAFGLLDLPHRHFLFASAGHPAPFVLRADGNIERPLLLPGPAAGITPTFDKEPYTPERIDLQPGDAVLLFTDGIGEARNREGQFYEETRMVQALQELGGRPAAQLLERLHADAVSFAGGRLSDDATLLLVRLTPA